MTHLLHLSEEFQRNDCLYGKDQELAEVNNQTAGAKVGLCFGCNCRNAINSVQPVRDLEHSQVTP